MEKVASGGKHIPHHPRTPAIADPAVFASAHAALKFALNFCHGATKSSGLAVEQNGLLPGRGLGGLDGAAQSGMILAELGRLETMRRYVLIARFALSSQPCSCRAPCCRGWREAPGWAKAIGYLTEYVLAHGLTGTISHFHLRRALVVRYFGVGDSFVTIASSCGVDRHTAGDYNKRIHERFRREERPGLFEIEDRLKRAGIVES